MAKIQRLSIEYVDLNPNAVGVWDIEATGLNGGFGRMLMSGIAPLAATKKKEVQILRIDQYHDDTRDWWNDKELVRDTITQLATYEYIIHFNGKWYDLPFLKTRAASYGLKFPNIDIKHVDMFQYGRKYLRVNNRSLNALVTHLECKHQKTPLTPKVWAQATTGNTFALDQIQKHNIKDVLSLAEATRKLLECDWLPWQYIR